MLVRAQFVVGVSEAQTLDTDRGQLGPPVLLGPAALARTLLLAVGAALPIPHVGFRVRKTGVRVVMIVMVTCHRSLSPPGATS